MTSMPFRLSFFGGATVAVNRLAACRSTVSRSFRTVSPPNLPKKIFGNDSFHRRDRFYQIFVQIGAILAIFRPFEVFGRLVNRATRAAPTEFPALP